MTYKKIGIMGAMPEEISALHAELNNPRETQLGDRCYIEGQLSGVEVVLVFLRWGKVASSITATMLIAHFHVSHILFTGVAGAVDEKLNIGDIVIGEKCFQHDLDPSPLFPKHTIPLTDKKFISCDAHWIDAVQTVAQHFVANLDQAIDPTTLSPFGINAPQVHVGIIASGDQFIGDADQTQTIAQETPGTLAVEMEGAAVAQACAEHQVPFLVLRVISDKANHEAHIDFMAFIQAVAAQYALHLVCGLLQDMGQVE